MRASLFVLAVALLAFASVGHALDLEDAAPVPEGMSLPNIFNPVTDRADGRDQAKALVGLVAKEPKVAYGVGNEKEAPIEDTWNGESDPESSASVAQKKMLKEVSSLEGLIAQGQKILKILPRKQARLDLLKQKLSVILDAKAKREAEEKLGQQEALLAAIKKREGAMSSRLKGLSSAQAKLEASVKKLRGVMEGKPAEAAKPAVKQAHSSGKVAGKPAQKPRFAQVGLDAEEQAEIGGDMMTQEELEQEAAVDAEAEFQMAAEQL